jgi:hypothetical protein
MMEKLSPLFKVLPHETDEQVVRHLNEKMRELTSAILRKNETSIQDTIADLAILILFLHRRDHGPSFKDMDWSSAIRRVRAEYIRTYRR